MNKAIKALFALLFVVLTVSGAFAAEKKSKPEIKLIDNYVAIFDFEVRDKDKDISRPLADKVIHEFSTSDRYKVIDRGNMNKILKEQKFQMSGCVAQECKVEAGQILGVGKIVSGSVGIVGKTYYLTLQLIDVRTGEILKSVEDECRCELDELLGSTRRLAKKLLSEQIVPPPAIAAKPTPIVESETEEIERAKAKAEAEAIAKAKEIERIKAEQIAKAKAEEIARAKAEAEAIAKAKEIERIKAEEIAKAKAEEIARAKAEAEAIAKAKEIERIKAEEISKPAEPEQKITNSIGMIFVYIKPGTFMMGSPTGEHGRGNDETQHQVTLTRGFYMQTTEVTQGQWKAVMGNNPSHFKKWWDGDNYPVEQVSWDDVQNFIRRLNQKEGINSYRLPTEAEWEYAARGGTITTFNTGNCLSTDQANYAGKYPLIDCSQGEWRKTTVKTETFSPNAWGLYDMHGNVWEWCQDWKEDYPSSSVTDPVGPFSGASRVIRGGSWFIGAKFCRSADRGSNTPDYKVSFLGFRLVKDNETGSDGRFIANSNGTVLDTKKNLMWAAKDNGDNISWGSAMSYCENYRGGGYADWRMPMQDELAGLYDAAKTYKSDCGNAVHLTELIRLTCAWIWASETSGSRGASFYFYDGVRYWVHQSFGSTLGRALPVRSVK